MISLMTVFAAGCAEEADVQRKTVEFKAFTDDTATRTELGTDLSVLWQENDDISLFLGSSYNNRLVLSSGAGSTEGVFTSGNVYFDNSYDGNYAVYPYSEYNSLYDGETVSLTMNRLQPYVEGGFGEGMNPMVAKTDDILDFTLRFRNVCGMLKVSVVGKKKISYAVLMGADGEPLAGDALVNVNDMSVTMLDEDETIIYLDCGNGVQLDPDVPTDLCFVVPPVVFERGFGVYLMDTEGGEMLCRRLQRTEIKRNTVLPMSVIRYVPDGEDDGGEDDGWKGVVETGWEDKTFHHCSVAMRFTADWCGYCPVMATAFDMAKEQLDGNLEVLSMHADGGLYFAPCYDLMNYYRITDFPTGVIDGRVLLHNYGEEYTAKYTVEAVNETESMYETVSGVNWVSEIKDSEARVDLAVYLKESGSYKITALVVEDDLVAWQNGGGNDYVHNGVPRMAFTSICGDDFSVSDDNEVVKFTYKGNIPSGCDKDNMKIVVYIHKYSRGSGLVDDYYIDNSASGRLGGAENLVFDTDGSGGTEDIEQGEDIEM